LNGAVNNTLSFLNNFARRFDNFYYTIFSIFSSGMLEIPNYSTKWYIYKSA